MGDNGASKTGPRSDSIETGAPAVSKESAIRSGDLVYSEGYLVIANGVVVQTHLVQLKVAPLFEWPQDGPVLIRGGQTEHAIEHGASLRLSKPEVFRQDDGTLIGDLGEGVAHREERQAGGVAVNAPADLKRAEQRDAEQNALAAAIGSSSRAKTTSTRTETTSTKSNTRTAGKNGWILCTSIRPSDEEGMKAWRESLKPEYDHVTTIRSPREFARALAIMVAGQRGPLGAEVTYTHPLAKQRTRHPSQSVFHGPVAYVDDPYSYIEQAANPLEVMLRSVFFKHVRFRDQREYRFVVWTESEPEARITDLEVSPDMLAALQPPATVPPRKLERRPSGRPAESGAATHVDTSDQPDPVLVGTAADAESETDPTPVNGEPQDPMAMPLPIPVAILMNVEHARYAFRYMVRDGDSDPSKAAAAFHAEQIVTELFTEFVAPIADVEWANGVMVIEFKPPANAGWEARLAVGPLGAARYLITVGQQSTEVSCDRAWLLIETLVEDLKQHGLERWPTAEQAREEIACISVQPPGSENTVERLRYTATITRKTIEDASGLTDAEVDRINAEVKSSLDDARITRIIVRFPSGQHFTLSGVRAGLRGTYSQRANEGSVTLDVSTMHPEAVISVDPEESITESGSHQVVLPDGRDTAVTLTATSPDGSNQSQVRIVLQRTD